MDLTKLSDAHLMALRGAGGDITKLSDDDLTGIRSSLAGPQMSGGVQAARLGGQVAQNTNDAIAGTLGAPVDLLAAGMRKVGVPVDRPVGGSESLKSGIDYVATLPGRAWDAVSQRSFDPLTEDRTSRFEPANRAEKIAAGVGQGVGTVLSTLAPAAAVASRAAAPVNAVLNGATRGVATQAPALGTRVAQVLASQPRMQIASGVAGGATTGATDNPLLGAAASLAVPVAAAVGRGVISPVANRLTEAERSIIKAAPAAVRDRMTPAQLTGSPTLRVVEETMAKLPLSSGPMSGAYKDQRTALQRAIMEKTGTVADDASPDTMKRAFDSLGATFDDLVTRTPAINADAKLATDVGKVASTYGRRLETNVAPVFKSYIDDLQPLIDAVGKGQSPQITGEVYKNIRSDIGKSIRNTKDGQLKAALGGLATALDDAVERSTSGSLREAWREARKQYAALKTVDKAMQGGTQAERASGNIPLGAFSGAVRQSDQAGFSRGRGQYGETAKLADFLATRVPDSGTVSRGTTANILTGGALFGGGAASGIGLPAAAAAAATPWAASKLYNTKLARAYLTNQAAGKTNLRALYGAEALRQAISAGEEKSAPTALARALMKANEKRSGAAR